RDTGRRQEGYRQGEFTRDRIITGIEDPLPGEPRHAGHLLCSRSNLEQEVRHLSMQFRIFCNLSRRQRRGSKYGSRSVKPKVRKAPRRCRPVRTRVTPRVGTTEETPAAVTVAAFPMKVPIRSLRGVNTDPVVRVVRRLFTEPGRADCVTGAPAGIT